MERHSFIWAVAADSVASVVNCIPGCTYWDPTKNDAPSFQPELRWYIKVGTEEVDVDGKTVTVDIYDVIKAWLIPRVWGADLPHLGESAGAAKRWDVLQVTPRHVVRADGTIDVSKDLGGKIMHLLSRFDEDSASSKWAGFPLSFDELGRQSPAVTSIRHHRR